jgi:MATE family multidrug resistance protein
MTGRNVHEASVPSSTSLSRQEWMVSLPVLFAGVSESALHTVQTGFLARVGTTELAAIALADTLLYVWLVPAIGLAQGMQIIVARRYGEGRREAVRATLASSFVLVLIVGGVLAAALWAVAPAVADLLSDSPAVSAALRTYLQAAAPGLVFYAGSLVCGAFFTGISTTRPLIWATLVVVLSDIVLGYALILGHLGLPAMGIAGAGLAFVGGEAAMFAYFTWRVVRAGHMGRAALLRRRPSDAQFSLRRLVTLSAPVSLEAMLTGLSWLAVFFVLGELSDVAVAVTNLAYACFTVLVIPAWAFADVTSSLVSSLLGRGHGTLVRSLLHSAAGGTYALTLPFVVFALLAPNVVLTILSGDAELVAAATPSLRAAAVAMLVAVPTEIWVAAVAGAGGTDTAFWFELLLTAVFVTGSVVSAVVLELSLVWVWIWLAVGMALSLALSASWLGSHRWQRKAV